MNEQLLDPPLTQEIPPTTIEAPTLIAKAEDVLKAPTEEKPTETAPAVEPVSVEDFKELLLDGADPADPFFKEFIDLSNKSDLTPKARAQELFKLQAKVLTAISEKGSQAMADQSKKWEADTLADAEFADGKLEPALQGVSKLLDKYGSIKTREAFNHFGVGNHPEIVRFLARVAKDLNEPGPDPTKIVPPTKPRTQADILYPNQGQT